MAGRKGKGKRERKMVRATSRKVAYLNCPTCKRAVHAPEDTEIVECFAGVTHAYWKAKR